MSRIYMFVIATMWLIFLHPSKGSCQNIEFDILEGEDRVEIPFQFIHNFIVVDVRLFGMLPMQFIFDTGAEHTILFTRQFADYMNVEYDLKIPILGSDMTKRLHAMVARSIEVELVGLTPQTRDILVLEEDKFNLTEITGAQIHGILGGGFFKNSCLEIDYRKQKLIIQNKRSFEEPGRSYIKIPTVFHQSKPYVTVKSVLHNGLELDLTLLLDTGAGLPLLLNNDSHESLTLPDEYILSHLGVGLGGYIEGYIGRIPEISIVGLKFQQLPTSYHEIETTISQDSVYRRNGVLGNQLLSRFDVTIDYVDERVYLKPHSGYDKEFKMDRSGLVVVATGLALNKFVVMGVIDSSPADEAGILPGDEILRIRGLPSGVFNLDQIYRIFQKKAGKKMRLTILRDEQKIDVEFRLRDLI